MLLRQFFHSVDCLVILFKHFLFFGIGCLEFTLGKHVLYIGGCNLDTWLKFFEVRTNFIVHIALILRYHHFCLFLISIEGQLQILILPLTNIQSFIGLLQILSQLRYLILLQLQLGNMITIANTCR